MGPIRQMKQLTYLHLGSNALSDEGVAKLADLTNLAELHITRCTDVTEAVVPVLEKAIPDAKIVH
jgi:hypothetical protein